MITYKTETIVYYDKKKIGTIKENNEGQFYYAPVGSKITGEPFATIAAVKASLEER